MKKSLLLIITVFLMGCATSSRRMNDISLGMTKHDVKRIIGDPESSAAQNGVEYFIYSLRDRISKPGETMFPVSIESKYFVRFVGGRVESYGRVGDFDSTKPFETKQSIDVKIDK